MRVALYVRVSTEEQKKNGLSVDNQIDALMEYAKENNYTIVDVYNDAGISARKTYRKRPSLLRLIDDVQNKKIDLILFTKLDRWFRSVADYYDVQRVLDAYNVPWRAIWEDYETETSAGIFKVNIMLSVAQSEADRTSERIKNTFDYKRAKGEYVGGNKAPIGYQRDGKKMDIDKSTYEAVKSVFEAYMSTASVSKAIQAAEEHGLHLNQRTADRILSHPAYYGGCDYIITPYITEEEHQQIVRIRSRHTKSYSTHYKYIFSGLCRCGLCGGNMAGQRTVRHNKNGTIGHSIRYVCKRHDAGYDCTGSSISEKVLENYMITVISQELDNYNLSVELANKEKDSSATAASIKSRLKRLANLYELGDIEFQEYKEKRQMLMEELEVLEKEPTQQVRQLPSNWFDIYSELDEDHKKAFWSSIVNHIEITGMRCLNPHIIF